MKCHTHTKQLIVQDDISNSQFSMGKCVWGDIRPRDKKSDKDQEDNSRTQKKPNYLLHMAICDIVRSVCEKMISTVQVVRVYCWFIFEITHLPHSSPNSRQKQISPSHNSELFFKKKKKRQCLGIHLFDCLDVCLLLSLSSPTSTQGQI